MNKPTSANKTFDYPQETEGSHIAAEVRSKANLLSDGERARHFTNAMAKIYGAAVAAKSTGRRH